MSLHIFLGTLPEVNEKHFTLLELVLPLLLLFLRLIQDDSLELPKVCA
jgi:hypothetical protein